MWVHIASNFACLGLPVNVETSFLVQHKCTVAIQAAKLIILDNFGMLSQDVPVMVKSTVKLWFSPDIWLWGN